MTHEKSIQTKIRKLQALKNKKGSFLSCLESFNLNCHLAFATIFSREKMAGWTGLEPAAFRVTGGRYNQLNYHPRSDRDSSLLIMFYEINKKI